MRVGFEGIPDFRVSNWDGPFPWGLLREPLSSFWGASVDRVGVFIDAGYLFAAGSILLTGEKLKRGQLHLNNEAFLSFMRRKAEELAGLPLLRVYWYDGTSGPPTPAHIALAYQPDVKLRLGLVNRQGEQKGVDSLIVTDLINLSRNRAMAAAVLMTGDEDIRVGVQQAQEYGVRVHLVGIASTPGGEGNQAALLKQESDAVCDLSREDVSGFLERKAAPAETPEPTAAPVPPFVAVAAPPPTTVDVKGMVEIVDATLGQMGEESIKQVALAGRYSIPAHIDGLLLTTASKALGGQRYPEQLRGKLRGLFFAECEKRSKGVE